MTHDHLIFDRNRVKRHRDRAIARLKDGDFILREMATRLAERLEDTTRRFPLALDLGANQGMLAALVKGKGGIEMLAQCDMSEAAIAKAAGIRLAADEELLPFAENSFDLVMSAGSLHWVNDLPGSLAQIRRVLKPGGWFLATLPGGRTLWELRSAFEQAELAASGGLSPRVSPFIEVKDGGSLLQRAGFEMCVADSDMLTVCYAHPLKLMHDLRDMGQSNAMIESRKSFTPCSLLMSAVDYYLRDYEDAQGRIPATFEWVTLSGWKPA